MERMIHYTELPAPNPDSQIKTECETYRREVGRLLAEGLGGQFVLIKGQTIFGCFKTADEALAEGYARFLLQPFLVQQVLEWEPVLHRRAG
jgi:hypothetical protein